MIMKAKMKKMLIVFVFLYKRESIEIKNEKKNFIKLDKSNYIKRVLYRFSQKL